MKKITLFYIGMICCLLSCSMATNGPSIVTERIPTSTHQPTESQTSSYVYPSQTSGAIMTSTNTVILSSTNTPKYSDQNNILKSLSSGRYIIYTYHTIGSDKYDLKIVSEKGQDMGKITDGGAEYRSYLSANQMYIAYSIFNQVKIFNVEEGQSVALPDIEGCFDGVVEMSWNPDSNKLAVTCGTIVILSINDGKKIGEISHIFNNTIHGNHIKPKWSPDGKWMAYIVQYGPQYGTQGPFVTDTSCITNKGGCEKNTRSLAKTSDNDNALLAWTPSNHLAVVDPQANHMLIYNVESLSLIRTITFPEVIHWVASIAWSPDEEWIAIGSDEGLSVMSIETGEVRQISKESNIVNAWYVVP